MREERKQQLRAMAEKLLAEGYIQPKEGNGDIAHALEELSIYEAELEAQNNELIEANARIEQQLKEQEALFNQAPVAYCLLDDEFNIIRQNMASIMLYKTSLQIDKFQFARLYKDEFSRTKLFNWLSQDTDATILLEYNSLSSNYWHELRKHLYPNGDLLIAVIDVTEQMNNHKELKKMADELLEAHYAKDQFLATMSHEIRTPLTGILGYLDIMDDEGFDPETADKISRMRMSASGLLEILNDILNISKLNANKYPAKEESFNIRYLLTKLMDMFHGRIDADKVSLELNVNPDVDSHIHSEPRLIRQIVMNLLGNAVKFTYEGFIRLSIEKTSSSKNEFLKFTIEDTGIGLGKANVDELFDEFTQHRNTESSQQGTGLGLAICRKLTDLLHGSIGAENRPEGGSKFWFEVPYLSAQLDEQEPRAKISSKEFKEPMSILAVDDNQTNRLIIKAIMEKHGHRCTVVNGGHEAVTIFQEQAFDLVIMDKRMPHMNGIEASETIKALPMYAEKNTPIICWTAELTFSVDLESDHLPFDDYLSKPVEQKDLNEILHRYHPANHDTFTKHRSV